MKRLAWPPRDLVLGPADRIYLRPRGLRPAGARGDGTGDGMGEGWGEDGAVLRLAGGPLAFGAVDLVVRSGASFSLTAAPLAELRAWIMGAGEAVAGRVADMLDRLSRPRPAFAGLGLDAPVIMGILNVTPDSFSDGGQFFEPGAAIARGHAMVEAGARLIDIGGESTRPGAAPVSEAEEIDRILPVIEGLRGSGAVLSVDTRHAAVAKAALAAGATVLNDVTALAEPASAGIARSANAAVVLMHMQGEPRTMQKAPAYDFAPLDVFDYLAGRVGAATAAGISARNIAIDPGIGFGKTPDHNIEILNWLGVYHALGQPLVIGVSRKSFIAAVSRGEPAPRRLAGSLAAGLAALERGAQIIRVHDVAETVQAVTVWQRIRG